MAEQSGPSVAAIQARQAALSVRGRSAAAADRVLADTVRHAHNAAVTAGNRLDTISVEIDQCIHHQHALAVDTLLGAHEMQRQLLAKQRELIAIVAEASREAAAKRTVLEALRAHYTAAPGPP